MTRAVVTGAEGFLGWHLRCRLHALTDWEVVAVDRSRWPDLRSAVEGADVVFHLAGVNRASDDELVTANVALANDLTAALRSGGPRPVIVVNANSVQAGNGSPYAAGKQRAADVLSQAMASMDARFVDVLLPNLFGEHGRPHYNAFVSTFVDSVVQGQRPEIADRPIELLHAQDAAAVLMKAAGEPSPVEVRPSGTQTRVSAVWSMLCRFHGLYLPDGDLPSLANGLERDLFNTYRAALFPDHYPLGLVPRSDHRGRLVETVRAHGLAGQTFVSTTVPGERRGQHYHLRKFERFAVLDGDAIIRLRRLFHDEVIEFAVSGREPMVIDMPTMWAHDITNTGKRELTTLFWTDSLFDPDSPDTAPAPIERTHSEQP